MAKKQVNKRRKFQIPINRFCRFTKAGIKEIDYKDVEILLKNIDESGKITEFNEKPQATEGRISGGYFVANKNLFDYVEDLETLVFEQEPMRNIVNDEEMMVYKHDGFWQPMDTLREKNELNELWSSGKAPWKVW